MLLNLLINYYVLNELICQDKYRKIKFKICQHYQLFVITEKLESIPIGEKEGKMSFMPFFTFIVFLQK